MADAPSVADVETRAAAVRRGVHQAAEANDCASAASSGTGMSGNGKRY